MPRRSHLPRPAPSGGRRRTDGGPRTLADVGDGMRVAVVGAGPAGLAALRALDAAGIDAVAFERGARVGGVWTLEDRPTAAYRSLHLITSRAAHRVRRAPDARRARRTTRAATRSGRYLEGYAERFGLRRAHPPRHRGAPRAPARRRRLGARARDRRARALRRARRRQRPQRGRRSGPTRRTRASFGGRAAARARLRASADDVRAASACWSSAWATARWTSPPTSRTSPTRTLLSVRHGSWVIPKRLLGQPGRPGHPAVGRRARAVAAAPAARADAAASSPSGRPSDYGLPRARAAACSRTTRRSPTRRSAASATARSRRSRAIDALERRRRALHRRHARGRSTRSCGARATASTIPFLDAALVGPDPQELPLYKRVLHLDVPDLLLRRADAVDRLGVPDRRAPVAAARRAPGRRAGRRRRAPRMRADCDAGAAGAPSRAGASTAARRCAWTSTAYMHELGRELEAGTGAPGGRRREPPRARHRRQRRVRHGAARRRCARAAGSVVGPRPARRRRRPDVLACDVTDDAAVPGAVAGGDRAPRRRPRRAGQQRRHRRARERGRAARRRTSGRCSTSTCSAPGA